MCIFQNKKASEHLCRVRQNTVGRRSQQKQANNHSDLSRTTSEKTTFSGLAQAEIVSILSPTRKNSVRLGPAQCQFGSAGARRLSFWAYFYICLMQRTVVVSLVDCEIPSSSIKPAAFRYRNTKQISTTRRGMKYLTSYMAE